MAYRRGTGLTQLRNDLAAARMQGLEELKRQLEDRVDNPGPSDPGEYPAKDTGEYAGSFFVTPDGVINTAPHAEYLEFKPPSEGGRSAFSQGAADPELQAAVAKAVAERMNNG